jgi:kynurenine 3-monooxygenase
MRSHVLSPLYHVRRQLDSLLSTLFPSRSSTPTPLSLTDPFPTKRVKGWTSLYEMVSFRPDVGYEEALRKEVWQEEVVKYLGYGAGVLSLLGLGVAGLRVYGRR